MEQTETESDSFAGLYMACTAPAIPMISAAASIKMDDSRFMGSTPVFMVHVPMWQLSDPPAQNAGCFGRLIAKCGTLITILN
jgi:hypothetical protein